MNVDPLVSATRLYMGQTYYTVDAPPVPPFSRLDPEQAEFFLALARDISAALTLSRGVVAEAARLLAYLDPERAPWGRWRTLILTAHPNLR